MRCCHIQLSTSVLGEEMLDKLSISETALLDRVLDCASIGLFVIDSDGLIIYCNSLLEKLVGTTAQELIGESYTALLDRIAGLSIDPQQTLRDMATALKHLEQVPTGELHPTPHQLYLSTNDSSFGRLQVRFFPFAGSTDRSWMWSGILHQVSQ